MSIPTGGPAALLVVATLALSSCGSDGASVTTTTTVSPGSAETTATQTVAAESTPAKTTTQKAQTTAPKPAQTTTQKAQTTAPAPKPAATTKASPACPSVDVGARDGDVDETYARITSISKTDCEVATFVIQQWGGQKIGAAKALLPIGWSCSGSTCAKGSRSVSFVLEFPSS
jgi:hypothetical protein